jgi:hypothetical protein
VNFCLIPEVPFALETFLAELTGRLDRRGHAVVVGQLRDMRGSIACCTSTEIS